MREHGTGDVLVVDDGELKGLLTDRDIVIRVIAHGRDPGATQVGEACGPDLAIEWDEQSALADISAERPNARPQHDPDSELGHQAAARVSRHVLLLSVAGPCAAGTLPCALAGKREVSRLPSVNQHGWAPWFGWARVR